MRRTKSQISFNMSRIRSKGTRIEQLLASGLRKSKIKFRRYASIIGKPDFIISGRKIAIFCDSAFWHGYRFLRTSRHKFKSNKKFWIEKIGKNIERDKIVNRVLKKQGWKILRFWDFQIKKDIDKCINKIESVM